MHVVETLVDFRKFAVVSDIFIDLELACHVVWKVDYGFRGTNRRNKGPIHLRRDQATQFDPSLLRRQFPAMCDQ